MIAPGHALRPGAIRPLWRRRGQGIADEVSDIGPIDRAMALLDRALVLTRRSADRFALGEAEDGVALLDARRPLLARVGTLLAERDEERPAWSPELEEDGSAASLSVALRRIGTIAAELGRLDAEIERLRGGRPPSRP